MSDPLRRALRTWLQVFSGLLVASPAFGALNDGTLDVVGLKKLGFAVVGATVTSLISFGQNALEDRAGTAFLIAKSNPDPEPTPPTPVPDLVAAPDPKPVLGTDVDPPAPAERPRRAPLRPIVKVPRKPRVVRKKPPAG